MLFSKNNVNSQVVQDEIGQNKRSEDQKAIRMCAINNLDVHGQSIAIYACRETLQVARLQGNDLYMKFASEFVRLVLLVLLLLVSSAWQEEEEVVVYLAVAPPLPELLEIQNCERHPQFRWLMKAEGLKVPS
ncbi:hypothetical protein PHLCEN_2v5844 [Hermanssonia centrifuga]|uniref:Uncharacterized protein n=1 Tax=Hermanssonia centrifuga TaxID=98765 RepID=A0A2R6P123_9APHY|nr:hypothetical protein PHLCEN_2v5844 [Hermanssonia centrifuga]